MIFLSHYDHDFRKPSEPEPFFTANCVSLYNAAGNLDVYSTFYRFLSLDSSEI